MILNSTDSISSDLKVVNLNIYLLPSPQVIGKYKIYFFLLVFHPASLQYQIKLGSGAFCVVSLTTVYYLCSERFWQPPEFLCYYKYTKKLFWFQNAIDCCRVYCVVSINSIQKACYGEDDRFCLSVNALMK